MRSTTFDMIALTLMALAVLITAGGGITWAYLRDSRGPGRATDAPPASTDGPEPRAADGEPAATGGVTGRPAPQSPTSTR
jgi:hypothetical protein